MTARAYATGMQSLFILDPVDGEAKFIGMVRAMSERIEPEGEFLGYPVVVESQPSQVRWPESWRSSWAMWRGYE
jgi:hypothetical protein